MDAESGLFTRTHRIRHGMDVEPSPAGAVRNYGVIDAEERQAYAEPGIPGWAEHEWRAEIYVYNLANR